MVHNNTARPYIDIECLSYENYRTASLDLTIRGYTFMGNYSLQRKLYDEMMEIEFFISGLSSLRLEQKILRNFAHFVEEMTWNFKDNNGWDVVRLTGFEDGRRRDDLVAFFVRANIGELAEKMMSRQNRNTKPV